MTKLTNSSTKILLNLCRYLDQTNNYNDEFLCCICCKETNSFYLICKPNCTYNSYCKICINKILHTTSRCPYTNIQFTYDDIAIDYRKNKNFENYKKVNNETMKLFNDIKNITIKIDIKD